MPTPAADDRYEILTCEYEEWLNREGIPGAPMSADDLLAESYAPDGYPLTAQQREWLAAFIQRWETAED